MDYITVLTKEGWKVAIEKSDVMAVEEDADYRNYDGRWTGRGSTVVTKGVRYSVRESFAEVMKMIKGE